MIFRSVLAWVGWNSFLALIPVALGYAVSLFSPLVNKRRHFVMYIAIAVLALCWMAFLPNTCYLLTEWRHFLAMLNDTDLQAQRLSGHDPNSMFWLLLYTLFFLGYSLFGMLTFTLAIRPVDRLMRGYTKHQWLIGIPFFLLISLGVYLGLVHRFNSWDILTRTGLLYSTVLQVISRPLLLAFIVLFGVFLWLSYFVINIWVDGFCLYLQRWKFIRK